MRKILTLSLLGFIVLAGCQQEIAGPCGPYHDTPEVYASLEASSETKTVLDGQEVCWNTKDQIAVFIGNTLRKRYNITPESAGGKNATFQHDPDYAVVGDIVHTSNNIAYYPFSGVTCTQNGDSYTIDKVQLPETQSYVPESFDDKSFPMVAVTADIDDVDFAFKNVCSVIAFRLKGQGSIRSLSIRGNSDEILSGNAVISASYGEKPEIILLADGGRTVTLDCGVSGVELQKDIPETFYICLPPVVFENGFTITVTDIHGKTAEYSTDRENSILRSSILKMPEKEFEEDILPPVVEYVDEYGTNHGPGIKIGEIVWAPVNCGYHSTNYPYGKLYQWGRKYGQGYKGSYYDIDGNKGFYITSDATVPTIKEGGVSTETGNDKSNENIFYTGTYYYKSWEETLNHKLWIGDQWSNPTKTEYDPCPEGWRVPTDKELRELCQKHSSWTSEGGKNGYWFSGATPYSETAPRVFLPASGMRGVKGDADDRGKRGGYWSSWPYASSGNKECIHYLVVEKLSPGIDPTFRAFGLSVRCIQE